MRIEDYVALRVKDICRERGISKYRLAQLTGMSLTAISKIMEKESIPTIPTLEKICNALGITLAQFFTRDEKHPDLTEMQSELLSTWDSLGQKERDILITFIRSLKK